MQGSGTYGTSEQRAPHGRAERPALTIRLLGQFQVRVDGAAVDEARWKRRRAKALVKLLALRTDHRLHREQLIDALWPAAAPAVAANQLNKLMHMARHALEPDLQSGTASRFLVRHGGIVTLQAPDGIRVDVDEFESLSVHALASDAVADYEAALAAYAGDLLDEDMYEDWVATRREELAQLRQDLLARLARALTASGRTTAAVARWNELVSIDPGNEDAHRHLMRIHAGRGDRRLALRQFERCRELLAQELGCEPDDETRALNDAIAAGETDTGPGGPHAAPASRPGDLAILPLRNATGNDAFEYYCEGITEALIGELARLPGMRVMALGTVLRYRGADTDPVRVGAELGVRAIVSARVGRSGDGFVIAVELIDGIDGTLLWSERYDRDTGDVLAVQDEIARRIAHSLRPRLVAVDRARMGRRHTRDSEAYACYLKGRFHWNRRTAGGLARARECFADAIATDPDYALAHAGLADCYNLSSLYGAEPASAVMPKAAESARRAIEIDPTLAEAHTSLGYYRMCYRHDWAGAEASFRTAIANDPTYATARQWYHMFLASRGRFDEADHQIREALALDPLSLAINTEAGWGRYMARRHAEAEARVRAALELDPRFPLAHLVLALALLETGRAEEAREAAANAVRFHDTGPFTLALGVLAHAHGRVGDRDEARRLVSELEALAMRDHATAYSLVLACEGIGDHAGAMHWLERALDARLDRLVFLDVEPLLDALRERPGFRELRRRLSTGPG